MKVDKVFSIAVLLMVNFTFAQHTTDFFDKANTFFKTYVSNGRVDYKGIKNNPASLDELLSIAAKVEVAASESKTYQAFHINAYNLVVIKGIVANYPTKSPLDIKGFFDKKTYVISGKETTINAIENNRLRKKFPKEARFHFALVCGGLGCPPIITEAYTPTMLEKQLQRQTTKALNDANFIKVKGNKVQLSKIFEWYKKDFTQYGSEIEFVNKFRKEQIATSAKVSYYPYNWNLNSTK